MRPSISGFVFLEEKMLVEIPNEAIWTTMTGGPTIFVTSRSVEGVDDVMACAWSTICNMAPARFCVSLMLPHQTTENLIKTGVFGISIPGTDLQKALLASGCCSGRVVGDKFAHLKLGKVAGQKLPLSFVEGALVHIECRVVEPELLKRTGLAIGEAVAARVEADYWENEGFTCDGRPQSTMHSAGETIFTTRGPRKGWAE